MNKVIPLIIKQKEYLTFCKHNEKWMARYLNEGASHWSRNSTKQLIEILPSNTKKTNFYELIKNMDL